MLTILLGILEEGLVYAIMALGVYKMCIRDSRSASFSSTWSTSMTRRTLVTVSA